MRPGLLAVVVGVSSLLMSVSVLGAHANSGRTLYQRLPVAKAPPTGKSTRDTLALGRLALHHLRALQAD